jgi:hypothetical protein
LQNGEKRKVPKERRAQEAVKFSERENDQVLRAAE